MLVLKFRMYDDLDDLLEKKERVRSLSTAALKVNVCPPSSIINLFVVNNMI
jgi:hypothetical protein